MNLNRAIIGPILSILFLVFFVYMISGVNWIFNNSFQAQSNDVLLGSVSNGVQNTVFENPTNTIGDIAVPVVTKKPSVDINAKAAISIENNLQDINKIIFDKNGSTQLPIASLTKLMTAVVVLDNYNLSDTCQVDEIADSKDSMKQDVKLGDKMSVKNFLEIMLIESSNKSAYALSEMIGEENFVKLMNQKAKTIGLKNTFFTDPTGLDSGDVSTAEDLAKLAEYILKNYPEISAVSQTKNLYISGFGNVTNTDELLGEIPEIICSKTGFTTAAKGCLLLVINNPKNNDYYINVILGADDRFSEMKKLFDWSSSACN